MEGDKLTVEKNANLERIKLLEHELGKARKTESGNSELSGYQRLQAEYEELKITNTVYLEKIEELVEQINATKDDGDRRIAELEGALEGTVSRLKDVGVASEVGRQVSDSVTVKTSVSKTNFGQSDDVGVLRKEIDTLKQRIVILTDKNMEYQNALADFKNRDRSRSKNVKK